MKENRIHDLLISKKDGMDTLFVVDQIEEIIMEREEQAKKEGFTQGTKHREILEENITKISTAIGYFAGTFMLGLFLFWIVGDIKGCNIEEFKREDNRKALISTTLTACSKGDYDTCRAGWLEFRDAIEGSGRLDINENEIYWNPIDASFEEAYKASTNKELIEDESARFSHSNLSAPQNSDFIARYSLPLC